jgi:hypothetical protein
MHCYLASVDYALRARLYVFFGNVVYSFDEGRLEYAEHISSLHHAKFYQ